jgi:hypothetical protein
VDMPLKNPFTDEHYKLCCNLGEACAITADMLKRLLDSGYPVQSQMEVNQQQASIAARTKANHWPDRP